ncbi:LamG domain-containing protein [Leptospira dzoumogneensis]|uniref:LamG domain-containing protein n=1 Tax=Leptospira dzoumogneensis TaxID=2484904 RepID=A0A4Z1AG91_9LEPT|nr:LamG domain-containing protein [Leptospira dzoumogneensis]TGM96689.1 LamG domain-containing protein [Leptospira dzoumogneensis]
MSNFRSLPIFFLFVIFGIQNCGTVLLLNALWPSKEDDRIGNIGELFLGTMNVGLIHYWPLDGDANDKVGSMHLTAFGTVGPTLTSDRNNLPGGAFQYDGIDSWHSSDPIVGETILMGTASFTLSAWVKGKFKPSGGGIIMGQGDGLGFQFLDGTTNCFHGIRVYTANGGMGAISNVSPCGIYQDDVWYHLTFTWDLPNNTANLYVGNDIVNSTVYNPNLTPWTSSAPFTLGYGTIGGGAQPVSIDEVRIYNRVVPPIFFSF